MARWMDGLINEWLKSEKELALEFRTILPQFYHVEYSVTPETIMQEILLQLITLSQNCFHELCFFF